MKQITFAAATTGWLLVVGLSAALSAESVAAHPAFAGHDNARNQVRHVGDNVDFGPAGSDILSRRAIATQRFKAEHSGVALYRRADRIRRVYGETFSRAQTAAQSAEQFIHDHAAVFGVSAENLQPVGPFPDGRHVQPIMYDADTDSYKFTGLYYTQEQDGVPVFRSRLTLLVRNEQDNPLVLAAADLRDLGGFRVAPQALGHVDLERGRQQIMQHLDIEPALAGQVEFEDARLVIWAGVEDDDAPPQLAFEQMVEIGDVSDPETYQKWLILVDAFTGEELFRENQILHSTVSGTVGCRCTAGLGASICHGTEVRPMPYARVSSGSTVTFADADGNFTLQNVGPGPVTVTSEIRGLYFNLSSSGGNPVLTLNQSVNSPGVVNFLHNNADSEEFTRAAVDAYYYSNEVRDFALTYNPAYPVVAFQTGFQINVNLNNNCNAFYNGSSVNYYTSGGGCANTAFSSVVHHEYGHHLVGSGGSGQGAYGEGMSDTVSVLITEDPILAYGFQLNCNSGIRSAYNNIQYPCSNGIHYCGQVLSGSVYRTMLELQATHPDTYRDIISNLTVNSILLHTGTSIDPSITIDFLTLDDDDGDIFNGTPHYAQINAGFGHHNMPAPELDLIRFEYPKGLPEMVAPNGSVVFAVDVMPLSGQPQPGTATLHYRVGNSGPFTQVSLSEVAPNQYEAELPGFDCGTPVSYFFSAESTTGEVFSSPRQAPDSTFVAISAGDIVVAFADDFNDDEGWTVGAPDDDATTGHWVRADPIGTSTGAGQAQPNGSFVGDACYITGQHTPGQGAGYNDVDHGKTTLFSPAFDLSEAHDATISYMRWYSNHAGANPFNDIFEVDITNDGGQSWVNVETVGPSGPQVMGGWYSHSFIVSEFVEPTSQVQVRFIASDYDPQALVEAAVDKFRLNIIECEVSTCTGDLNGDGSVDGADLLILLSHWGPCAGCASDLSGSGFVNGQDLLILLSNWGECP
jgi:hypothetical protein